MLPTLLHSAPEVPNVYLDNVRACRWPQLVLPELYADIFRAPAPAPAQLRSGQLGSGDNTLRVQQSWVCPRRRLAVQQ